MEPTFFESSLFQWVVLPLLIFMARILDVSIGTIRIIFVSKGEKKLAPLLGFFEVLIWVIAIGQVMQNLSNVATYIAYAGGFATGNYVGMFIESKLAMGILVVRVITAKGKDALVAELSRKGYGTTSVDAEGSRGPVTLIYSVIKRKNLAEVVNIIQAFDPKAFYSVEDARAAKEGVFPSGVPRGGFAETLRMRRRAK